MELNPGLSGSGSDDTPPAAPWTFLTASMMAMAMAALAAAAAALTLLFAGEAAFAASGAPHTDAWWILGYELALLAALGAAALAALSAWFWTLGRRIVRPERWAWYGALLSFAVVPMATLVNVAAGGNTALGGFLNSMLWSDRVPILVLGLALPVSTAGLVFLLLPPGASYWRRTEDHRTTGDTGTAVR